MRIAKTKAAVDAAFVFGGKEMKIIDC